MVSKDIKKLGVKGHEHMVSIAIVNGEQRKKVVQVDLKTRGISESKNLMLKGVLAVRSLPKLSQDVPGCSETLRLPYLRDVQFPELDNKQVHLLIGVDNLEAHEYDDERQGSASQPRAVHTTLGWTLFGKDEHFIDSHSTKFINVSYNGISQRLQSLFSCDLCDAEVEEEISPSMEDRRAKW